MLAKKLKPGVRLGATLVVESVDVDGDVVRVRFENGAYAEYHADERVGG